MELLSNINTIFGLLGIAFGIFMFFYYRKIKFYIFISKIFKFRRTTEVSLIYLFNINDNINIKELRTFLNKYDIEVMNAQTNNLILNLGEFVISFKKDDLPPEEFGENAAIKMTLTRTYYKQAKKTIDLFINICEEYKQYKNISGGNYTLSINYRNIKNPYLSANAHRIEEEFIKSLIIKVDSSFLINDINEEVLITKQKLSYTSDSPKNVYKIASEFMII